MNTEILWHLIDQARADVAVDGVIVEDEVARRMTALLARRDPADIVGFAQPLWDLLAASYQEDLWAAAYLVNGGASDDGFEYFRGWLIAQGRSVFNAVVADPDSLADVPAVVAAAEDGEDLECEDILACVWDAHRAVTGEDLPAGAFTIRYPNLDITWDFEDADENRRRLPRLSALYNRG